MAAYYLGYHLHEQTVDNSEIARVKLKATKPETVDRLRDRMNQIAKSVGMDYKDGGKIDHTRNTDRMIYSVQKIHMGKQDAVVEGIFSAYHELEQDITDLEILRLIAERAGLDGDEVMAYLRSDHGIVLIEEQAYLNRARVTTGVPTFLIDQTYQVDGAQDLQDFVEASIKAKEQIKEDSQM